MTAPLLVLDASTYRGTVALVEGGRLLGETEAPMRGATEERLMPAVASLLREIGVEPSALGGVACGDGPGSFTSLRIAASIAKGLVTASACPLFAVSSLVLIVAGAMPGVRPGRYLSLLDAMRGEWFAARIIVSGAGAMAIEGEVEIVDAATIGRIAREEQRVTIGPGQSIDVAPHARGAVQLAGPSGLMRPVDPASWEPYYGRLAEAQARWERSHGRPLVA